jgi:uncharacterized heparinase superfamily protein
MDKSIVQSLYTASLDEHAVAVCQDCVLPDFAGTPPPTTPGTYWRTLRHMRGPQLYNLVRNRILPKATLGRGDGVQVKLRNQLPPLVSQWKPDEARSLLAQGNAYIDGLQAMISQEDSRFGAELRRMSAWRANCFDLVNIDFTSPADAPLLRQTLRQIVQWWEGHSTDTAMGGEPLALSLRILNLLKFVARNSVRADELGDGALVKQILQSLRLQTLLLERCLEKHLLNNHLIINAEALMFTGTLLECPESRRWWLTGESLLKTQLSGQILSDGGQMERSPTYQTWLLEHLVEIRDLVNWSKPPGDIANLLRNYAWKMADFLRLIKHPDGQIPLLNDSAMDFACSKKELDTLLARAGTDATAGVHRDSDVSVLSASGYGVLRDPASGSHFILDCGPLGPGYQLGHGHCDVLSFELSLRGQRIIVDTGVSCYQAGRERHYERSTAAHNTLRIDGEEQAELWASYRIGRNPRVGSIQGGHVGEFPFLRGEHYAYDRQKVTHCRTVVRQPNDCWIIVDYLYGTGSHKVESFIHLHPFIQVEQRDSDCLLISSSDRYVLTAFGVDKFGVKESYYCPGYGLRQTRAVIQYTQQGSLPMTLGFILTPAETRPPKLRFGEDKTVEIGGVVVPLRYVEGSVEKS